MKLTIIASAICILTSLLSFLAAFWGIDSQYQDPRPIPIIGGVVFGLMTFVVYLIGRHFEERKNWDNPLVGQFYHLFGKHAPVLSDPIFVVPKDQYEKLSSEEKLEVDKISAKADRTVKIIITSTMVSLSLIAACFLYYVFTL